MPPRRPWSDDDWDDYYVDQERRFDEWKDEGGLKAEQAARTELPSEDAATVARRRAEIDRIMAVHRILHPKQFG